MQGVTVRDAGPGDAVEGVQPRWVALPESVEEIAAVLRSCAERDLAVVPVGGGTKLHWGSPPERCDVLLDLCCLNEIVEHAAGDLVVRTQPGVTMEALAEVLAGKGQELALDVPLEGATVGGTLATATAGPRSLRYGTARDLLIGITVVLADGTIARSGGKVVKNVAGYDLGKLFTGSYGTLGVIAEATFRLHPLPADRRWVVGEASEALLETLAASQAEPSGIAVDLPSGTVAVLLEGSAADRRAAAIGLLMGGRVTDTAPGWWGALPGEGADDEVLVEVRARVTEADALIRALGDAPARMWVADHLVAHVAPPPGSDPTALVTRLREDAGWRTRVVAGRVGVDRWGAVDALPLMRRVKERFDPGRRMSPGRFVGGI
ncbi:FAD-binding oxidoreductase [Nonomuraea sp. NPDC050556]|uniref:FAD-binding oxidoreductase n=1 Tax=Nonomuraea sp. NPDC050556 TaxID=3364369 RepID=UPI0037AFBF6A